MACCDSNSNITIYDKNGVPFAKKYSRPDDVAFWEPQSIDPDYSMQRDNKTLVDYFEFPFYTAGFMVYNQPSRPGNYMYSYTSLPVEADSVASVTFRNNGFLGRTVTDNVMISLERSVNYGAWNVVDKSLVAGTLSLIRFNDTFNIAVNENQILIVSWRLAFVAPGLSTDVNFTEGGTFSVNSVIKNAESTL